MSDLGNTFADNLAPAFAAVIRNWFNAHLDFAEAVSIVDISGDVDQYPPQEPGTSDLNPASMLVVNLPRVVIVPGDGEEAIYQSGNMRIPVEIQCKADLDTGGYPQAKALFTATLDAVQQADLITQLNAATDINNNQLVGVQGIVITGVRLNETGDRMFVKTITVDCFGYSVPITQPGG